MTALEFRFPPEPEHLRALRSQLRDKLAEFGVPEDLADNVLLVTDEIVSNAIEHAEDYRGHSGRLLVRVEPQDGDVLLEFEDPDVPPEVIAELAEALAAKRDNRPPPDSERGRGLFLIAHNVKDLEVKQRDDGGLHLHGRFTEALA